MTKSAITNDPSEARNKGLNSPVFSLVHRTWRHFDEEITSISLKEEDIVRYVLWSIENIKGGEDSPNENGQDLRRGIVNLFRDSKYPSDVVEPLSNIICSYVLVCLYCACLFSYRTDIYRLCSVAQNSIKKNHLQEVLECKESIKCSILQSDLLSELGEWCTEHLLNDVFLTEENAEWFRNDSSSRTMQVEETEGQNPNNGKNGETKLDITPILKYCSDSKKCETIVQMLSGCNTVEALKSALISIDADGSMIDMCTMDNLQFCRDIIPLISYETNARALKQVIHRIIPKYAIR